MKRKLFFYESADGDGFCVEKYLKFSDMLRTDNEEVVVPNPWSVRGETQQITMLVKDQAWLRPTEN